MPLANTANDPSYPGAHATFSQAAATVLEDFFGTDVFSFSLTNSTVGITRTFSSFSQAADEAAARRIFAGQHFRYDEDAGQALGGQVADVIVDHAFAPRRDGGHRDGFGFAFTRPSGLGRARRRRRSGTWEPPLLPGASPARDDVPGGAP